MTITLVFLIFGITLTYIADSARILGVSPSSAYSHHQLAGKLLKRLAASGHEVTVITPYTEKIPMNNYTEVILTGEMEKARVIKSNVFDHTNNGIVRKVIRMYSIIHKLTERVLSHANVQNLLKSSDKFDLVIIYQYMNEAYKGFCGHYDAPCIVFNPMVVPYWTHAQIGNPDNPAYFSDMYSGSSNNNFLQRLYNSAFYLGIRLFHNLYALPRQNELLQKYFSGTIPHLTDLYYNTSLILVNSHGSIQPALPYVPNMIEIGGFHVSEPKELPKDLKEYLDNAKDGAILFSMGSILKSKDLPKYKFEGFLKVFSTLKQKVLWKWENETIDTQPPNVKFSKWLPQQDILAHPNIRAFITHGGISSTTEAIYHGVPIISIPVFSDQDKNAATAENAGYGLTIPYKEFTEEKFSRALNEILYSSKYSDIAKRTSQIMHDEPLKPMDKAIFWVEYIIRHQGAPHLRSAVLNLNWYQYMLLDGAAVVFLAIIVLLFVIFKIIKIILCCNEKCDQTDIQKEKTN